MRTAVRGVSADNPSRVHWCIGSVCRAAPWKPNWLIRAVGHDFFAAALPPLRPASFFCAVVPPCFELDPDPLFFPPRLDAPGEFAILAARSLDMPLSFRASYCFSFFTLALLLGTSAPFIDLMPRAFPLARRA